MILRISSSDQTDSDHSRRQMDAAAKQTASGSCQVLEASAGFWSTFESPSHAVKQLNVLFGKRSAQIIGFKRRLEPIRSTSRQSQHKPQMFERWTENGTKWSGSRRIWQTPVSGGETGSDCAGGNVRQLQPFLQTPSTAEDGNPRCLQLLHTSDSITSFCFRGLNIIPLTNSKNNRNQK